MHKGRILYVKTCWIIGLLYTIYCILCQVAKLIPMLHVCKICLKICEYMIWLYILIPLLWQFQFVKARKVFDKIKVTNLYTRNNMLSSGWVAWNSIVVGYAQIGKFVEALQFYGQFRRLPMRYEFSLVSVF